jgi:hypothetical protein
LPCHCGTARRASRACRPGPSPTSTNDASLKMTSSSRQPGFLAADAHHADTHPATRIRKAYLPPHNGIDSFAPRRRPGPDAIVTRLAPSSSVLTSQRGFRPFLACTKSPRRLLSFPSRRIGPRNPGVAGCRSSPRSPAGGNTAASRSEGSRIGHVKINTYRMCEACLVGARGGEKTRCMDEVDCGGRPRV